MKTFHIKSKAINRVCSRRLQAGFRTARRNAAQRKLGSRKQYRRVGLLSWDRQRSLGLTGIQEIWNQCEVF